MLAYFPYPSLMAQAAKLTQSNATNRKQMIRFKKLPPPPFFSHYRTRIVVFQALSSFLLAPPAQNIPQK
jgi:hypothetical protein